MRRGIAFLALVAATTAVAAPGSVRYVPLRSGFLAADIPAQAESASPDNYVLTHDGQQGSFGFSWSTPHTNEREFKRCGTVTPSYRTSKPRVFAYSCLVGETIVYHIEKYGRTELVGASYATETVEMDATYPAVQSAFWNPIITRMSQSLRVQNH